MPIGTTDKKTIAKAINSMLLATQAHVAEPEPSSVRLVAQRIPPTTVYVA